MAKSIAGPLRLVVDTNIIVSGLLWNGAPRHLLLRAGERDDVTLFTSAALIAELSNTLARQKFEKRLAAVGMTCETIVGYYRDLCEIVEPAIVGRIVLRDADDDVVIATALAAKAHAIVSGDRDLTDLDQPAGITVLTAIEAIELIDG